MKERSNRKRGFLKVIADGWDTMLGCFFYSIDLSLFGLNSKSYMMVVSMQYQASSTPIKRAA
jgi:hypothetical protein